MRRAHVTGNEARLPLISTQPCARGWPLQRSAPACWSAWHSPACLLVRGTCWRLRSSCGWRSCPLRRCGPALAGTARTACLKLRMACCAMRAESASYAVMLAANLCACSYSLVLSSDTAVRTARHAVLGTCNSTSSCACPVGNGVSTQTSTTAGVLTVNATGCPSYSGCADAAVRCMSLQGSHSAPCAVTWAP